MKIETSNPATSHALSGKENVDALKASVLSKETVGTAHPTAVPDIKGGDSLNISFKSPLAEKNLSTLLMDFMEILNIRESSVSKSSQLPTPNSQLFESLFYKGEEPLSFLKLFIERSGLLYEAKVAKGDIQGAEDDLKGLLLRVIEKHGEKSEAGKTANTLLNDIEAKQLMNVKGKEEGVFYLHIPVLFPQGASTAEVQVRRDGKGKSVYGGDSYRVVFSIELREAGHLSIDAAVNRTTASIRVQGENAEFLEFMRHHLPVLAERLSGYGFKVRI